MLNSLRGLPWDLKAEQVADDALARQEKGLANQERVAAGEKLGELSGASLKVAEAANG